MLPLFRSFSIEKPRSSLWPQTKFPKDRSAFPHRKQSTPFRTDVIHMPYCSPPARPQPGDYMVRSCTQLPIGEFLGLLRRSFPSDEAQRPPFSHRFVCVRAARFFKLEQNVSSGELWVVVPYFLGLATRIMFTPFVFLYRFVEPKSLFIHTTRHISPGW